jgi:NTP pyrophosphatase (non-canonical NTP hydrolase)
MQNYFTAVREFHHKYGFSTAVKLTGTPTLLPISLQLETIAKNILQSDDAETRLHLIIEEVSELAAAMHDGNKTETLDALADLLYVVIGTAVTFNLPLHEAFLEVHRSNMTKSLERSRPGHPKKGDNYSPPNLCQLLNKE